MADTDILNTILGELRSPEESTREHGLQRFQDYVRSSLASGKSDDGESFWNDIINKVLVPLTAMSDTAQEKLVGIAAIDKLLLSPSDDAHPTTAPASHTSNPSATSNKNFLYRLQRYLKNLLPDPNLSVMAAASQTYGAILRVGGQVVADNVMEFEIQHAVNLMKEKEGEWSGTANRDLTIARQSQQTATTATPGKPTPPKPVKEKILASHARIAGVLILVQIATHAPHIYYQHVSLILGYIMPALRDPSRFLVNTSNPSNPLMALLGSSSGIAAQPQSAAVAGDGVGWDKDGKSTVEARDVVRRLAAKLFGVTLAVIEEREPGIDHSVSPEASITPSFPASLSKSAARIERTSTLSTIYHAPQSGSANGGHIGFSTHVPTNKPLVKLVTAASNDIANYISSVLQYSEPVSTHNAKTTSASQSDSSKKHGFSGPGDVNRAFGALLIYRELFESGLASLAGVFASLPSSRSRIERSRYHDSPSKTPQLLTKGGAYDHSLHPSASTSSAFDPPPPFSGPMSMTSSRSVKAHDFGSPQGAEPILPITQFSDKPMLYPQTFRAIFHLATAQPPQQSHSTSLLAVSTHSIANLLSPASPTSWGSTSIAASSVNATTASLSGASAGYGADWGTGIGWSSPLPQLNKTELEEQLRKEALSLLPVCAAYDTERFVSSGLFSATMMVILTSWGYKTGVSAKDNFEDRQQFEVLTSMIKGKVAMEKGDRSYLVRILGELTFALRNSSAMISYIKELGVILNGCLESRLPPPAPWRYNSYYSDTNMSLRHGPGRASTVKRSGTRGAPVPVSGKRASTAMEALAATTGKPESAVPAKGSGSSAASKQSKGLVIPKGCVSDEVLFEAIALISMALEVHATRVISGAGRSEDAEAQDDLVGPDDDTACQNALDKMFRYGLNPALALNLPLIARSVPVLLSAIQVHFLNEISMVLTGHGYHAPGAPMNDGSLTLDTGSPKQTIRTDINVSIIRLALGVLQTFDWRGKILTPLIQDGVLGYLDSRDREVRMEASLATCKLFMKDPIAHHTSTAAVEVTNQVVEKLIRVALSDPDPEIRSLVLSNLDESYDRHLAQVEHVRAISMAVNDEEPQARIHGVRIIGRLALRNPATVMPSLRVELLKLLTELEYSADSKAMLTAAEVLTSLLKCTDRLVKPYVPAILRVCLPKAKSSLSYVSRRMIQCIGLLAGIAGDDLISSLDEIMDLLVNTLQDPTASVIKKDIALVSLGQVCGNTANVVDPYVRYPQLMGIFRRFLRGDSSDKTKRKVLQVMGILGAVDPYLRRSIPEYDNQEKTPGAKALQQSVKTVGSQPEVFYQSVVIQSLLTILSDASLGANHPEVIDVLLAIFKTQGMKCVPFLPQIIPAFVTMCRSPSSRHQDFYLQQMSLIVQIIGGHIRNFMEDVFQLIADLWPNPVLHLPIVGLVESLATAMAAEFKKYLPVVVPQLLTVFTEPPSAERNQTEVRVFHTLLSFGSAIEDYTHLILPVILNTIESKTASPASRKAAVHTISGLTRRVSLADSGSRIVQPLLRTLPSAEIQLQSAIVDALCALLLQMGSDFALFIPRIADCLQTFKIPAPKFDKLAGCLMKGEPLPQEIGADERWSRTGSTDPVASADLTRPTVNQIFLKHSWSTDTVVRQEDWQRWFKTLSLGLMRESTSQALRACVSLADTHEPLAKELFNAAFYSCWVELSDSNKEDFARALTQALTECRNTDIRLRLLSVAEFMEHEDKMLPIDTRLLGDIAAQTNALAKALHYKEQEFLSGVSNEVVEQLIGINAQLKQKDAALGLLFNEQLNRNVDRLLWYEQLGRWEQASILYKERRQLREDDQDALMGQMRCLHALSEWEALNANVETKWPTASLDYREELAPMAASSAWVLRKWDQMEDYVASMSAESTDRSFFKAILSVHNNQFDTAYNCISRARDALQTDLGIVEDYNRVYGTMVRIQLLSELEEIITYKKCADQPDKRQAIRKTWVKRLRGCQRDVDTWQRVLQLRSLVLSPSEDAPSYIKFANLCRKEGRWTLAESVIQHLLADQAKRDSSQRASPAVVFAHLRLIWDTGEKLESLGYLVNVCASLAHDIGLDDPRKIITGTVEEIDDVKRLLSRAYLKQGEWRQELQQEWTPELISEVMQCYHFATQLDPKWYKAWHTWALCNFEVINHLENVDDDRDEEIQRKSLLTHIIEALVGFFRSIALGGENPIQDSLRLLTLWFKFGADEEVSAVVAENFGSVSIDTWLEVIPQLIARIQTPSSVIRQHINSLLTQIGRVHPQALIYPLTVASKSNSSIRVKAANEIIDRLREHSPLLVEQALMVSHELIRVAILWHELWHEYLEEASRLYFTEKRPEAMIEHLEALHRRLDLGPETTREASFVQVHGKDLREAREACHRYLRLHETTDMDRAWDIYYAVFRRIEKQLPLLTTIDLQYVSPRLLSAENLELVVPGTYKSGKPMIRITRFVPKLSVIASKQRPRRLAIMGSDGKEYQFLLKGHEDLRQDERVMQVFSLVNTLLSADRQSFMRNLHIQGYAAIPLAPNVGLLQWVRHADTLHVLVSDYRAARKIHLQIEYRLMLQMAPDYVNLTMLQKLEVFKYALDNTTGQDLYRVLWLTSGDSEAWLERRSTYTRSLAVSSMVGHILGLGDRHPANLLLDQYTGKVIHIDFGDCFEIAMHREKFPERVPFRLTRMLVSAMEVSGIDGSFKVTSEITMNVLRHNREPLLAVLEAFIYDPLVSWRLTTETETRGRTQAATPAPNAAHAGATGGQAGAPQLEAAYTRHTGGPRRRVQLNEGLAFNEDMTEWRNARALEVYQRVQKKLTGRDFNPDEELTVEKQVEKLIRQATALENLCQAFPGWCPFW